MTIALGLGGIVFGFVLLWKGGDLLTENASKLATLMNVPELLIGLTVVAFGTSAPELVVAVYAAFQGNSDIVIGNVLGSNIANTLLILGISAFIAPIAFSNPIALKDLRLNWVTTLYLLGLIGGSIFLFGHGTIGKGIAGALLLGFVTFMLLIKPQKPNEESEVKNSLETHSSSRLMMFGGLMLGLIGLMVGGRVVVDSIKMLTAVLGLSEVFLSLFLIAIGTSLPELVTSVIATRKGRYELVIGNVLGSNMFNILLVLGISGWVADIQIRPSLYCDGLLMGGALLLLSVLLLITPKQILSRSKGIVLLATYITYIVAIFLRG
ncbi:calcium/sodium antiporter [bacterium]|jgi:cation:H+ antiporter|nr:calcium/sodium antiporter [bacterium]